MNDEPSYRLSQVAGYHVEHVLTNWYANFEHILLEHKVITKASSHLKLERISASTEEHLLQSGYFDETTVRHIKAIGHGSISEEHVECNMYTYTFTFPCDPKGKCLHKAFAIGQIFSDWLLLYANRQPFGFSNIKCLLGWPRALMWQADWLINDEPQLAIKVGFTLVL